MENRTGARRSNSNTPKSSQKSGKSSNAVTNGETPIEPRADNVDTFNPRNPDSNVDRWLNNIDHLGRIHKWSDDKKIRIMHDKLRGRASTIFVDQAKCDLKWDQWKTYLRRAFPAEANFAYLLKRLVKRTKGSKESMTEYYNAKLKLCEMCGITGENAVCCIIDGLPLELQASGYVFGFQTPDKLYSEFLSCLERPMNERDKNEKVKWCYTCGGYVHADRDCPFYPKMNRGGRVAEKKKRPSSESEKRPKSESEKKTKSESEKRSKFESEKRLNSESKKRSRSESEKRPNSESEKRSKSELEKRANSESEKRSKSESEKRPNSESEKRPKSESGKRCISCGKYEHLDLNCPIALYWEARRKMVLSQDPAIGN